MTGEGTVVFPEQVSAVSEEVPGPHLVSGDQLGHGGASVGGERWGRALGGAQLVPSAHNFQLDLVGAAAGYETCGEHVDSRHRRPEHAARRVVGAAYIGDHVIKPDGLISACIRYRLRQARSECYGRRYCLAGR
jgi:hypothetical protein